MTRIATHQDGPVVTITLGDGHRRNALGERDWSVLTSTITSLSSDPGVSALVLAGHGGTFSAGSDLTEWAGAGTNAVERCFGEMERCFRAIEDAPQPVIAAVEGAAAGAGCQLVLACDLSMLARDAHIGMPIARLGILASPAFVARVSTRVGATLAADLYLTGRLLSADEALSAGLVTRVVTPGDALPSARTLAGRMSEVPPAATSAAKSTLRQVMRTDLTSAGSARPPKVSPRDFGPAVRSFLARHRVGAVTG